MVGVFIAARLETARGAIFRAIFRPSSAISRIFLAATPCIMPQSMADAAPLLPRPFHYRL
jgi:hypothetical protein